MSDLARWGLALLASHSSAYRDGRQAGRTEPQ